MSVVMYGGELSYFTSPVAYQRGHGLGNVLRGIFRSVVPLFKKPAVKRGLKTLGRVALKSALAAGEQVQNTDDVSAFLPAFKQAGKTELKSLIQKQVGSGGRKRRRVAAKKAVKPIKRRRVGRDVFAGF